VELFAQRAAAVVPAFAVTEDNHPHVVDICRRLDGIPLAIELAAVRLRGLSVQQLAARLDDRFRLLATGQRGRLPHHRTAVDWSFELCDRAERTLWARASVFAGGFDLEAAEEVCAGAGIDRADVVDLVDGLVGKSILICEERAGRARYRMLDTLRQYGRDRLREAGEEIRLGRAHADRHLRLAGQAERDWFGPDQLDWLRWLRDEHDNLRAALDFFLTARDSPAALRMAGALWFHWGFSGRVAEGRVWLERALALPAESTPARARALWAAAVLASAEGRLDMATELAAQAGELADRLDDGLTAARAVARAGTVAMYRADTKRVEALTAQALAGFDAIGRSDSADAVIARLTLAFARMNTGDLAGAAELCRQCMEICRAHGDQTLTAVTLNTLAVLEWSGADLPEAAGHARDALLLRGTRAIPLNLAHAVEILAWIAATAGECERAAVLLGAADLLWRTFDIGKLLHATSHLAPHRHCEAAVRRSLGDAAFDRAHQRGNAFTLDDIVAFAVGEPAVADAASAAARTGDQPSPLTRREREVAALVAEGLSNKDVAARLVISQRTAESHIEHILQKLGYTSRTQIAAWAASRT
jgi:non-specific serine/threonine protein kinase